MEPFPAGTLLQFRVTLGFHQLVELAVRSLLVRHVATVGIARYGQPSLALLLLGQMLRLRVPQGRQLLEVVRELSGLDLPCPVQPVSVERL